MSLYAMQTRQGDGYFLTCDGRFTVEASAARYAKVCSADYGTHTRVIELVNLAWGNPFDWEVGYVRIGAEYKNGVQI